MLGQMVVLSVVARHFYKQPIPKVDIIVIPEEAQEKMINGEDSEEGRQYKEQFILAGWIGTNIELFNILIKYVASGWATGLGPGYILWDFVG